MSVNVDFSRTRTSAAPSTGALVSSGSAQRRYFKERLVKTIVSGTLIIRPSSIIMYTDCVYTQSVYTGISEAAKRVTNQPGTVMTSTSTCRSSLDALLQQHLGLENLYVGHNFYAVRHSIPSSVLESEQQ